MLTLAHFNKIARALSTLTYNMNLLLKELAEERQDRQEKRSSSSAIIQPVVDLTAIVDDEIIVLSMI